MSSHEFLKHQHVHVKAKCVARKDMLNESVARKDILNESVACKFDIK